jgi:hypothetical protein
VLLCDLCGIEIPEGEHHGLGFEVLCESCYGDRYDAHVELVTAAILAEDSCSASAAWRREELGGIALRFGADYAAEVESDALSRARRRAAHAGGIAG